MTRTYTYFVPGPHGTQSARTGWAHDYENGRGDHAVVIYRKPELHEVLTSPGSYDVSSAFFSARGFKSKKAAAHALIDHSPVGCCDWEEVW